MKSNVLFVSICVLIVGLFSLCACTATVKEDPTDPSDPGTSQPDVTGTDPTYESGLTEKTYDPNAEESGDFGSLFGSDASAQSQQGSNSAADENAVRPSIMAPMTVAVRAALAVLVKSISISSSL